MFTTKSISTLARHKGLAVGLVIGFLIGSAGVVFSGLKKEGWAKQPAAFKLGYIAGFTDVVRMVKRSTPEHEIAREYTVPVDAKPINWLYYVEKVLEEEEARVKDVTQAIAIAGSKMVEKYGRDVVAADGLEQLSKYFERRRAAIAAGNIEESPPDVRARRNAIAARQKATNQCVRPCRDECRDTCKAKVDASFPPIPELLPRDEPTPEKDKSSDQ